MNAVKFGLVLDIVQEHDDGVQFVQIVDLNLAFLYLSEGGQGTDGRSSHLGNLISEHFAKRGDGASLKSSHLANLIITDGSKRLSSQTSDITVCRTKVIIQTLEHMRVEHKPSSQFSFKRDVQQTQDQDENLLFFFFDQLVYERWQNIFVNNCLDSVGELCQIDQAIIGVISDLGDRVIEKLGNDFDQVVLYDGDTADLSSGDEEHGSGSEFTNFVVGVAEALNHFGEDA